MLRHSHFPIVPFCRTCAVNGMRATLSWLHFFTRCPTSNFFLFACVSTPHMKMILEVFKSTLLSPSNDTRRFTTHAVEPRHAAKIQLSCRPCVYVHVLEESAEVRNTVLRRDSHKDHESDAKSTRGSMPWPYPCVRVCQEPFPPWTEQHHPRSPPNNLLPGRSGSGRLSNSAVPVWTDTHCVLSHTPGQQPGECWLCKAEPHAKICRRRDVKSRRRLPPNAPMAAPHQDAMPYGRFRSSPDETASNRKLFLTTPKECGCDEEPTTLQRMWPSAASPSTRNNTISMPGSRVVSFLTINSQHMKKKKQKHVG